MARLLLTALLVVSATAAAQPWEPGPGWATVGDAPSQQDETVTFDPAGTLYRGGDHVDRFVDDAWIAFTDEGAGDEIAFLGAPPDAPPDTAFVARRIHRTTDGGATWHEVPVTGVPDDVASVQTLLEVPPEAAFAGRLLAGGSMRTFAVSTDRGGSFQQGALDLSDSPSYHAKTFAALPESAGLWGAGFGARLLFGGWDGVAASSDGGETWTATALWARGSIKVDHLAVLARPEGGLRVVALGEINGGSGCERVWTSDDAGVSWTENQLPCDPRPCAGVACVSARALLPLSRRATGAPERCTGEAAGWPLTAWETPQALAVLGRGYVVATADGGATWAPWAGGPIPLEVPEVDYARDATLGPDGRLYAALKRIGADSGWIVRSAGEVVVAEETAVPERTTLGVAVRPNPSAGDAVTVELSVGAPAQVRATVVDAVGRTVAELYSGPLSGTHAVELSTSAWAAGVYTVVVESAGARRATSFTIAR